jgi:hypothetical protein
MLKEVMISLAHIGASTTITIYIGQASLAREIEPNGRNWCGCQPVGENVGAASAAFRGDIKEDTAAIESNDVYND